MNGVFASYFSEYHETDAEQICMTAKRQTEHLNIYKILKTYASRYDTQKLIFAV